MRLNWKYVIFLVMTILVKSMPAYAVAYNIVPKSGIALPTQLVKGNRAPAFYTVTNNTQRTLNNGFVKYLPPNVTQVTSDSMYPDLCGATFTLTRGASCTLELLVAGEVFATDTNPAHHLFICSPNVSACAGTNYPLNVMVLPATISGTVQSGGTASITPIANASVIIYKAGQSMATIVGSATTDSSGKFYINIPLEQASGTDVIFYAIANKNNTTKLATIIGSTILPMITINEMTTIGAAYSMAQFFHGEQIYGNALGLEIASSMNNNLISSIEGNLSSVIQTSPNADETNARRSVSSLSNLLTPCVLNPSNCLSLFAATTVNAQTPTNTLQAVLNIAHNPANNVPGIFTLANAVSVYLPKLAIVPDAWTLAVKFNNSGNDNFPFGGPAPIVFDSKGFAWISNNVIQGTPNSSNYIMVLQPNGQPADGNNNTPISPIFGGGLLGSGFGISIDQKGSIWVGAFGWGTCPACVPTEGVVSEFTSTGIPISGPEGYISYVARAQGTVPDKDDNIWIASYGNDRIVVFPKGDPNAAFYYQEPANSGPFDLAFDAAGVTWVTNSTSNVVSRYALIGNSIVHLSDTSVGDSLKQVSIDSQGNAWVASVGDSTVYQLNPLGTVLHSYSGVGGISGPWGVSLDGDDNVWVANFQPLVGIPTNFSVSKLCGVNIAKCPLGLTTGDPISPPTGYTLPSAGSQVLLHNGTPLYGPGGPPAFNPLMRLVQVAFDKAGNAWTSNNWKPRALIDITSNPGGDGVVVFVGLAGVPE
ncbi:Vgb family protein [Legionella drancourtii]|uniref:NHL repeat protein n=1 Tax=Legionella drancourtii LLAP12 TaxID=658187 RepID=G9ETR7_9GAMM|nr:hypothetical protein [Legionella drancourtii]EHL29268.1 hypothetical protein LDG_8703 [Legionella drancourtii LLAP12]